MHGPLNVKFWNMIFRLVPYRVLQFTLGTLWEICVYEHFSVTFVISPTSVDFLCLIDSFKKYLLVFMGGIL